MTVVAIAVDLVRASVAEQVAPLETLQQEIGELAEAHVDVERARGRIRAGAVAFDPVEVIGSSGDLVAHFSRATVALERAGLASNREATAARGRRAHVTGLIAAWLAGEAPFDRVRVVAQLAAGIVGGAILRRASSMVRAGVDLEHWHRSMCPCCGGWPDIALRTMTMRALICSRCDTSWTTDESGCIWCGARSAPALGRIDAEPLDYALTICNSCGRYLKECGATHAVDPLVERTLTADLDAAAWRRGLRV